ncbi:phage tail sheath family protein [Streptomyces formicae]|uniref:Phage tail sheath family protein n=1 Tax=Streptomyces formicae TaxID=1616117 RepID=A0ABY3WKQ3_9ACTN|nr:phage tail sheath subtilisin-like domain-containing protein [Streptomyces formicae]UNM13199.1 phage tail sheath family protein [Streptomyces formicae]
MSSGARSVTGASTSVPAFLGFALAGPTNPTLVRGWNEYLRTFGQPGLEAALLAPLEKAMAFREQALAWQERERAQRKIFKQYQDNPDSYTREDADKVKAACTVIAGLYQEMVASGAHSDALRDLTRAVTEAAAAKDLNSPDQEARTSAMTTAITAGLKFCDKAEERFTSAREDVVGKIITRIDSLYQKAVTCGVSILKSAPRDETAQNNLAGAFEDAADDWSHLKDIFTEYFAAADLPQLADKLVRTYKGELTPAGDPEWCLGEAVYGFFANGGSSCYIIRLDDRHTHNHALLQAGLDQLETVQDASMVAVPDLHHLRGANTLDGAKTLLQAVAKHCADMRNRVAILDAPQDKNGVSEQRAIGKDDAGNLGIPGAAKEFATLYYPWITVPGLDGTSRHVPPCGHIAGVWARTDAQRGVFKAPANETLQNAIALPTQLSDDQQAHLNEAGINCLRVFPGRGILVWGARTLATDSRDGKYLNVRRLVCFLAESIKQSTNWAVFESNDEHLWATLRQTVKAFLKDQWRQGALQGATPDEAYQVICDNTNNRPEAIQDGHVTCDIYIAPVRPAEFIHFQVQQTAGQPTA